MQTIEVQYKLSKNKYLIDKYWESITLNIPYKTKYLKRSKIMPIRLSFNPNSDGYFHTRDIASIKDSLEECDYDMEKYVKKIIQNNLDYYNANIEESNKIEQLSEVSVKIELGEGVIAKLMEMGC